MRLISASFDPDDKWTDGDRLLIITSLARELVERSKGDAVPRLVVLDTAERMELLACRSAGFLEANRKAILDGQEGLL